VAFSSTLDTLVEPSSGQARVEALVALRIFVNREFRVRH
jgi:hypothetical protein